MFVKFENLFGCIGDCPKPRFARSGFTLIELLVVLGIIALLAVLTVPAFNHMSKSSSLTTAAHTVIDQLNLARQTALSRNNSVEVRFYRLPAAGRPVTSSPEHYRGMQLFLHGGKGPEAIGKPVFLPPQIIISGEETLSSIVKGSLTEEKTPDSGERVGDFGGNYRYRSFYFKPGGATDLPDNERVFLTLANRNDTVASGRPPRDFITIQIDATTGRVRSFRP